MPGLHIPPTVWGPFFWHTIHLTALGYPKEPIYGEKRAAKEFFESLSHLIPCPICKKHYAEHLKNNPITPSLDTRADLFTWTVKLHNVVNATLKKPEFTEQDAIQFYARLGEQGRSPVWTPEDFQALEYKSFLIGFSTVVGFGAIIGIAAYLTQKE
jgi:hypothetical protein